MLISSEKNLPNGVWCKGKCLFCNLTFILAPHLIAEGSTSVKHRSKRVLAHLGSSLQTVSLDAKSQSKRLKIMEKSYKRKEKHKHRDKGFMKKILEPREKPSVVLNIPLSPPRKRSRNSHTVSKNKSRSVANCITDISCSSILHKVIFKEKTLTPVSCKGQ